MTKKEIETKEKICELNVKAIRHLKDIFKTKQELLAQKARKKNKS